MKKTDKRPWAADKVERRPVSALVPSAKNARIHSEKQIAQLAAAINEWGWTIPVLVDENDSIIAGHGRVLAARKLRLKDVPVMVAVGWSEAQKRAYVLADNKLASNSSWDEALFADELAALGELNFDIEKIGIDIEALELDVVDINFAPETTDTSHGVQNVLLKFGKRAVPLTPDEIARMEKLFVQYTNESGVSFGFVHWLCDGRGEVSSA